MKVGKQEPGHHKMLDPPIGLSKHEKLFQNFIDMAWAYDPVLEYTPAVEEDSGEERFLTKSYEEIVGWQFNAKLAPKILMYEEGTDNSILVTSNFKEFYLHNQPLTNFSANAVIRYGQDLTSKEVFKLSNEPVYSYLFEYQGRYWPGTNTTHGVFHHDDLTYLFYIPVLFPEFKAVNPE
ncbi:hypothetical protein C0J52_23374 [Blattella germanica]|nr:hypothetical protein C0J52_23374 [Blattella germanica]